MADDEKGIAEAFARHVWPAYVEAPLQGIRILSHGSNSDVLGCVSRAGDGYTVLVAGGRPREEFVSTLFHELGHVKHGAIERGKSSHSLGLEVMAGAIRGERDAIELHKAVRNPDPDEEQWCDDFARSRTILYADRLAIAAGGDEAPLASMLYADLGPPRASTLKARGGAPPDARPKQLQAVIKAAVGAGGEWVLDVLGAPFGSVLDKDGDGEWFDGATDFHPDQFGLPPAVYYHGWTPEGKPSTAPAYIGKTIRRWVDGAGVWFRVVLNKASAYARRVWEAAQQDRARASTGAIPHLARVSPSGHILEWPIGELSLLDVEGGRRPVNRHAVALPVMKALYDQAGMELPRAAYGVNPGCEREIRRHAGLWRCKELLRQIREMD